MSRYLNPFAVLIRLAEGLQTWPRCYSVFQQQ